MGILKIKCFNCGANNELTADCVYDADTMNAKHIYPYRCPHCMAEMDQQTWNKLVSAFWEFEETNNELRLDVEGCPDRDNCLFQAEYKTHFVPQEKVRI